MLPLAADDDKLGNSEVRILEKLKCVVGRGGDDVPVLPESSSIV